MAFELPATISPYITPIETTETSHTYLSGTVIANASPITETTSPVVSPKRGARTLASRAYTGEPVVLEGIASYYSKAGCLGCNPLFVMANGQVLDDNALTMAIGADRKHLVGYNARVTNLATGKSVVVRITDTGGFYKDKYGNRVADLTIGTKTAIGMKGGLGRVRVEVL
jgi:rare lipoprotein A (peptidoglycan hydrolase)